MKSIHAIKNVFLGLISKFATQSGTGQENFNVSAGFGGLSC